MLQRQPHEQVPREVVLPLQACCWLTSCATCLFLCHEGPDRLCPPAGLIPFTLGQVYQVISPYTNKLDNVVELYSKIIPPTLPGVP